MVEYASQLSGCPIAAITFIDEHRQWFKAKVGDTVKETPRSISFCAHTILSDDPLIIEDATKDERFEKNPDVIEGLNIRFYAGVAIYSRNKHRLGAVCVIDNKPRKSNEKLIASLRLVSKEVSNLLGLHVRNKVLEVYSQETLENSVNSHQLFFEKAALPCWIYDLETLKFLQVNEAAIKKYGYTKEEFLNLTVYDIREKNEKLMIHQLVQGNNTSTGTTISPSVHCTKFKDIVQVEVTIREIVYMGKAARMATINDVSEKERFKSMMEDQKSLCKR